MATRVKKRTDTSATNRESDKIIVRLPEGMREAITALADTNSRSMTAEVVDAIKNHLNAPDHQTMIRDLWGMIAIERAESESLRTELKDLIAELRSVATGRGK